MRETAFQKNEKRNHTQIQHALTSDNRQQTRTSPGKKKKKKTSTISKDKEEIQFTTTQSNPMKTYTPYLTQSFIVKGLKYLQRYKYQVG
jgi:phosphorylcholine metabolism protein LicD